MVTPIHPLFAISDKLNSYKEIFGAFFTLEGSEGRLHEMQLLLEKLGNPVQVISSKKKSVYHSSAVFVSNFMTALSQIGIDLLISCGFDEHNALLALNPLMIGNVQNIVRQGTIQSLTGPIERCDIETVTNHLHLFDRERKRFIYFTFQKTNRYC